MRHRTLFILTVSVFLGLIIQSNKFNEGECADEESQLGQSTTSLQLYKRKNRNLIMLLHKLILTNLLSFEKTILDLKPLNILIGHNGSGKSNLIEAISLIQSAPGSQVGQLLHRCPTIMLKCRAQKDMPDPHD
jgi:hypothetical protein